MTGRRLAFLLALWTCGATAQTLEPAVAIYARYERRVAHIETIGILYNGSQEVSSGSGLLVADGLVLTNHHVIPNASNYQSLQINIRFGSRQVDPIRAVGLERDSARDLALLELPSPRTNSGAACPMPAAHEQSLVPTGSNIFALGFPLDQELSITGGLLSRKDTARARWQTDTVINIGNSGGPFFASNGALIGLAVGGVVRWRRPDGEEINVQGVNFLIPLSEFVASPLFARISAIPPERRCWEELRPSVVASADLRLREFTELFRTSIQRGGANFGAEIMNTIPPDVVAANRELLSSIIRTEQAAPQRLSRVFPVDETKDDHPVIFGPHRRDYERTLVAETGYQIRECGFRASSANNESGVRCEISPDGRTAFFRFTLQSGPAVDRWRGWWSGTITLVQERSA